MIRRGALLDAVGNTQSILVFVHTTVSIQLLPPLGHTRSPKHRGRVRPLLAQQGGRDPGGPPRHDRIWHRGPPPHKGPA